MSPSTVFFLGGGGLKYSETQIQNGHQKSLAFRVFNKIKFDEVIDQFSKVKSRHVCI